MKKAAVYWGFLVLLALGLPVLVVEGLLRLLPSPRFAANIVFDPLLGNLGPKGAFVDFAGNRVYYNQLGYRDRPYDPEEERRNGKVRIAVLGDSITEAVNLADKEIWPAWTVNILNSALKPTFSLYRFAASDWGTFQETLALERDVAQIEPKLVLLEFLGLNDYINNGLAFAEKNKSENDGWRPYFDAARPNDTPIYLHRRERFLRRLSAIYRFFDAYYVNGYVYGSQTIKGDAEACDPYVQLFVENNEDPRWRQAFQATNGIAKRLSETVKPGQLLVAVYFPSLLEVSPKAWQDVVVGPLKKCAPGARLNRRQGEMIFETAFRASGIETFSLSEAFRAAKNPEELYDSTGHLTPRGHQLAGEQIAFRLFNEHAAELGGKR